MIRRISDPIIEIHDLTLSLAHKPVLWGVDVDLPRAAITGIMGPNGGGKSSLLKAMMAQCHLDSGYVRFEGKKLAQVRKRVSYMPQRQEVDWEFPIQVQEVVMMGRYVHMGWLKWPSARDKKIVADVLADLDIAALAERQIGDLSGGQQQRVFFARALAQQADIYLLDEPFVGIDMASQELILQQLKSLTQQGKTVVLVDHNLPLLKQNAHFVLLLNTYLRAAGTPQEVLTPELLKTTFMDKEDILSTIHHIARQHHISLREDKE